MDNSPPQPRVPRPKNGIFDSLANAQAYYHQNRQNYPIEKYIPLTLENANQKEGHRGALLLMANPNAVFGALLRMLNQKLAPLEKPGKKDIPAKQNIYYFYKKTKKMVQLSDSETLRARYE